MLKFYVLFIVIGILVVVGAAKDWDWFMNSWRARALSRLIGRKAARIFYVLIGISLVIYSALAMLRLSPSP